MDRAPGCPHSKRKFAKVHPLENHLLDFKFWKSGKSNLSLQELLFLDVIFPLISG